MISLTVAIPNFNGGENLRKVIESCEQIQLPEETFEIMVADNNSTDDSYRYIEDARSKFKNIRLVKNDRNLGRIANWNVCLNNSRGKYILLLFVNDRISQRNNIHRLIKILDADETISLAVSSFRRIENGNAVVKRSYDPNMIKCSSQQFTEMCLNRSILPFGVIQSILYRAEDFKRNYLRFDEGLPITTDQVFTFCMSVKRQFILFNPVPIVDWFFSPNRFHNKIKIEEEINEQVKALEVIASIIGCDLDCNLSNAYRVLMDTLRKRDLMKGFSILFRRRSNTGMTLCITEPVILKTMLMKIMNPRLDTYDLLVKAILLHCQVERITI